MWLHPPHITTLPPPTQPRAWGRRGARRESAYLFRLHCLHQIDALLSPATSPKPALPIIDREPYNETAARGGLTFNDAGKEALMGACAGWEICEWGEAGSAARQTFDEDERW